MPDVDGIELLRHVRGVDAWSNLPVISETFCSQLVTSWSPLHVLASDPLLAHMLT